MREEEEDLVRQGILKGRGTIKKKKFSQFSIPLRLYGCDREGGRDDRR